MMMTDSGDNDNNDILSEIGIILLFSATHALPMLPRCLAHVHDPSVIDHTDCYK